MEHLAEPLEEARTEIVRLRSMAQAQGLELRAAPEEPDPRSCCGRGCHPCMYTYYFEAYEKWRAEAGQRLAQA